jgi:predicted small secreted protein
MTTSKMMKFFSGALLVILLAFSTSGCGTISGRGYNTVSADVRYYKGIQGTYQFLTLDNVGDQVSGVLC